MSSKHVLEAKILSIAQDLFGRSLSERDFRSHFGGPSVAIEKLWNLICMRNDLPKSWGVDNLLIGLFFLQNPGTSWSTSSSQWGIHPNTFKKHLMWTLQIIVDLLPGVIYFY
jgi:hypothetical protein